MVTKSEVGRPGIMSLQGATDTAQRRQTITIGSPLWKAGSFWRMGSPAQGLPQGRPWVLVNRCVQE